MTSGSSTNRQQNNIAFNFVVLENPSDALQQKTRKQVRSHVTRVQHRRARDERSNATTPSAHAAPLGSSSISRSVSLLALTTVPQLAAPSPTDEPTNELTYASPDVQLREAYLDSMSDYYGQSSEERRRRRLEAQDARSTALDVFRLPDSALGDSLSRGEMSFRTFALDDTTNTIGQSLNALGLDLASIMVGQNCFDSAGPSRS